MARELRGVRLVDPGGRRGRCGGGGGRVLSLACVAPLVFKKRLEGLEDGPDHIDRNEANLEKLEHLDGPSSHDAMHRGRGEASSGFASP